MNSTVGMISQLRAAISKAVAALDRPTYPSRTDATPDQSLLAGRRRVSTGRLSRVERAVQLGIGLAVVALVGSIAPGISVNLHDADAAVETVTLPLTLPEPIATAEPTEESVAPMVRTVTVQPGETLGQIFDRLGIAARELHRLLEHPGARGPLTRIRAGAEFEFEFEPDGAFSAIRFDNEETERTELRLADDGIHESTLARDVQRRTFTASGEIAHSLFAAGAEAGISDATLLDLANVFSYDIDFAQDIRTGDRFTVVYEEIWRDGERLRSGGIVAASFTNQGKKHHAFRYVRSDGREDYFDSEGRPIKKGFLRMPIEFARISSRFNPNRRHPVLGTVRAHQGVDYAAATGTPIRSAGDGRVTFAGWKGGYGRAVIIDHGRGYTTLYGHMSRFGRFKVGSKVRQGEVIGQVGKSGLATGPHLHYEFRVKGVHRDPLKVTLPKPEPLPAAELARFNSHTGPLIAQLELLEGRRFAMLQ